MHIDNEMIRAMQDCATTKARISNLYKKSEDLRGVRNWDLHTRDQSLKAAPESIAATKTNIAAKENELVGVQAVSAVLGTDIHSGSHACEAILVKPPSGEACMADTPPCREPAQEFQDYHGHVARFMTATSGSCIAAQKVSFVRLKNRTCTGPVRRNRADAAGGLLIPRNSAAVIAVMLETIWSGPELAIEQYD